MFQTEKLNKINKLINFFVSTNMSTENKFNMSKTFMSLV